MIPALYHRLRRLLGRRAAPTHQHPAGELIAFLTGQICLPQRAGVVLDAAAAFYALDAEAQVEALPGVYLLLEQYLMEVDPVRTSTRARLRETVQEHFPLLVSEASFGLIFEAAPRQEVLLCRLFLLEALRRAVGVLGGGHDNPLTIARAWIEKAPDESAAPIPFGAADQAPDAYPEWLSILVDISRALYEHLHEGLGEASDRIYDRAYAHVAHRYAGLETFPVVIRLLPDRLLDEQRIQSLSRHSALAQARGALSDARQSALDTASQLQAVLNTVGEGIVTMDVQGRIVLVNHEIERIFGYSQAELIGAEMSILLKSADREKGILPFSDEAALWQCLGQWSADEGLRKDGTVFPVEICINETRISGRFFYTAAIRDVTVQRAYERDLIRAKEHAEEMTRLKTTFVANISHELRTPLAGIMGIAQVLGEEVSAQQRELTGLIYESGQRLLDTLNSVLEFARLEAGIDDDGRRQRIDFARHLERIVASFRPRAAVKDVSLDLLGADRAVWAEADPARLERIMHVLLNNAVKFTERGRITVAIEAEGRTVRIDVRDTGVGIDPAFRPHLFDEFRQESEGLARSHEGAGLGLAIARRLVEMMEGTISVESEKGRGSLFTVRLPVAPHREEPASQAVSLPALAAAEPTS